MIIPNSEHIFQKCFPQLEDGEEEILYPHPIYDLSCNQIGIIYPGESITYYSFSVLSEKVNINDLETVKTSTPKSKLIAQCFAGSMEVPFSIIPLDGNPYNTTRENYLYPKNLKKLASENFSKFKAKSLEHMLKRDVILKAKGLYPGPYWALQKLPDYLRNLYEKETGYSLALDKYGFPKQTSWGEEKTKGNRTKVKGKWVNKSPNGRYRTSAQVNDLRRKAHELLEQGMTKSQIANEMEELNTYVHYLLTSKYQPEKSKK